MKGAEGPVGSRIPDQERSPGGAWSSLLKAQFVWTVGLGSVWIIWLFLLPVDPDYTAGELLDHLLAWKETGTLYSDPAVLPHRVLNYPPLFLLLARGLTVLGIPAQMAGRFLGSAGVLLALLVANRWLKEVGVSSSMAVLGLGLAGSSFPILYSAGQFHLEGLAAAATLGGFWLGRRGGWWALMAGLLLALGCFFKQTQVVLSLVALLWMGWHRPRGDLFRALGAFGVAGVVGSGLISLFFGPEAWRHMLGYTVGTFSFQQLGAQQASFTVSWIVFIVVAFRASMQAGDRWKDPRTWYLLGTAFWTLSAIRRGSSYPYFLDFHLAVLLWVVPLLDHRPGLLLRRFLTVQMVVGSLVVGAILARHLHQGRETEEILPSLCAGFSDHSTFVVSGSPGLARACGRVPALHPFIAASLAGQGLLSTEPFEVALEAGEFGNVLLSFDPWEEVTGVDAERWTPGALSAFRDRYVEVGRWGGWRVLAPNGERLP